MQFIETLIEKIAPNIAETRRESRYMKSINARLEAQIAVAESQISELNELINSPEWLKMGDCNLSRTSLAKIYEKAQLMFLQNPLIRRAIRLQTLYVFALGYEIRSKVEAVDKAINAFFNDPRNKAEIGETLAMEQLEETQGITGNVFYAFFTGPESGDVKIRTIDVDQIADIKCNPKDAKDPWFYIRRYDDGGQTVTALYPDINYVPVDVEDFIPVQITPELATSLGVDSTAIIHWETPILHRKTGAFKSMRFGLPDVYAAMAWALSYKNFLEDWCTIMRAYSRIAMQLSAKGSAKDIAGAKSKLDIGAFGTAGNMASAAGFFLNGTGGQLTAVKTAGATTSADEGYAVKLMTAAATDLPGTFFGDADVGNYATAQTLDRPTELKFKSRQGFWICTIQRWVEYMLIQKAKRDMLPGFKITRLTDIQENRFYFQLVDDNEEPVDIAKLVEVEFPDIIERNMAERIRGIIGALTLNGNPPTDILQNRVFMARMLLKGLGLPAEEIDKELKDMYPSGKGEPIKDPALNVPKQKNNFGGGGDSNAN